MGLAKKGSRSIVVGTIPYRWVVSPNDGFLVLVVELAEKPGQRLEAFFGYDPQKIMTPDSVRKIIEFALTRGWKPAQRGLKAIRFQEADLAITNTKAT